MRAVAFTMLARGSGPEQRTRLAVQWRQISCEYRGWGQVAGLAWHAVMHARRQETLIFLGCPRPRKTTVLSVVLASVAAKERVAAGSFSG